MSTLSGTICVVIVMYCGIGVLASEDSLEDPGDVQSIQMSVIAPSVKRRKVNIPSSQDPVPSMAEQKETDDLGECPDPELIAMVNAKHRATTAYNTTVNYWKTLLGMNFNYTTLAWTPILDDPLGFGNSKKKAKIWCVPVNRTENETLEVQLVNSTSLLQVLGNKNETNNHCTVVLFFAPWCMFCAQMAPHYNALARAFPELNVLAIDAVHFSSLNTRYGTIAVPNLLVFYNNSKAVAKFNHTDRRFNTIVSYVSNITGFKPDPSVQVLSRDFDGPLSSKPTDERDWLLWLAWTFVIVFCLSLFAKSSWGRNLWNTVVNFGIEHQQHID